MKLQIISLVWRILAEFLWLAMIGAFLWQSLRADNEMTSWIGLALLALIAIEVRAVTNELRFHHRKKE